MTVRDALRNEAAAARHLTVAAELSDEQGGRLPVTLTGERSLAPQADGTVVLRGTVPAGAYARWELDASRLYRSRVVIDGYAHEATFGFRSLEVRGGRFLLNGRPVRLAGANRARATRCTAASTLTRLSTRIFR